MPVDHTTSSNLVEYLKLDHLRLQSLGIYQYKLARLSELGQSNKSHALPIRPLDDTRFEARLVTDHVNMRTVLYDESIFVLEWITPC